MAKQITYDMLDSLGSNFRALFKVLNPNGLCLEELEQKANEHNFYRMILNHVIGVNNGEQSMEF